MTDRLDAQTGDGHASDEDLIARIAQSADRSAFAELFQRYAGRVKAFLMRAGADAQTAEDATQDVMVTLWRKAASFNPERARAATWLYTIARNRRIDLLRRAVRAEPDPNDPLYQPDPPMTPERTMASSARDAEVRRAIAGLSEEQTEVIRLAFFTGLSHGEIAEELGLPLGTVKSRLRLAFGRIRGDLGASFAEELLDD